MGVTILGPESQEFPSRAIPTIVQLKRNWSDQWTLVPELELLGADASTSAHDVSSCTLFHRYGVLKHPWEPTDSAKYPTSLAGCWVRVGFAGRQGMQEAWIGRIVGETRDVFGARQTQYGLVPAGAQCFEALGPLSILRRIDVGRSLWRVNYETVLLDWVAPLNEKYGRTDKPAGTKGRALGSGPGAKALGSRSGNRSKLTDEDDVYVHGDYELWDYLQYANYILAKFVDESKIGGPSWRMGGQADVLSNFADPIEWGVTQNVDHILRSLIRPEFGLDYKIVSTDSGFEVYVFVLTRQSCGWGGNRLPGNPDTVKIYAARTKDSIKTEVEKTSVQRYGTIRINGARIIVCTSLWIDSGGYFSWFSTASGLWNRKDEQDYVSGDDSPEACDLARLQDRFINVFRLFGPSDGWWVSNSIWRSPRWNGQGSPLAENGPLQTLTRSTLPILPLENGVDYSQKPVVDNNSDNAEPTLRSPGAWFYDIPNQRFVAADQLGIGVSVLPNRIGMFLHASPNHLIAPTYVGNYGTLRSNVSPVCNCNEMVMTLAYPTDQRIYCEQKISGAKPEDGVLEIDASECQLWWLAPGTFLDVDKDGHPILSPSSDYGGAGTIVRNDWARLAAKMSGALARYFQERSRAQITVRGLRPWSGLLGQILTVIDEGGSAQTIEAPITNIRWTNGDNPTTIISTGFAGW